MTFSAEVLWYLLGCRLLIVGAGIASLSLGYRLFAKGVAPGVAAVSDHTPARSESSTINTSVLGVRFSISNAAPGTAFALFGATLILVMVIQSSPAVSIETLQKAQSDGVGVASQGKVEEKISMRGETTDALSQLTALAKEKESRGDTVGAERAYRDAVTTVAEPINDLAWLYLQTGRAKEAASLATLAVQMRSDEPRYVDTLEKARAAFPGGH